MDSVQCGRERSREDFWSLVLPSFVYERFRIRNGLNTNSVYR